MATSTQPTKARLQQLAADLGLSTKGSKADLAQRVKEHQQEQQAAGPRTQSQQLRAYRGGYEPSRSHSGNASLHNGDNLAQLLAGATPKQVVQTAELVLGLERGTLQERYDRLNPGQQRLNSGNRLRAALKREEATLDDVAKALAKAE